MRGCLGFVVVVLATIALFGFLLVQLVIPAVVTAAVADSPYFRGQAVTVRVDTSVSGLIFHRTVDAIKIEGQNLREDRVAISSVSVTLSDVSILDHSFAEISGSVGGLDISTSDGPGVHFDGVRLLGSSATIKAIGRIDADFVAFAVSERLRATGVTVDSVSLGQGRIDLSIGGHTIAARLSINDAGLVLDVNDVPLGGSVPPVTLLPVSPGQLWQLAEVSVVPAGVWITAEFAAP